VRDRSPGRLLSDLSKLCGSLMNGKSAYIVVVVIVIIIIIIIIIIVVVVVVVVAVVDKRSQKS